MCIVLSWYFLVLLRYKRYYFHLFFFPVLPINPLFEQFLIDGLNNFSLTSLSPYPQVILGVNVF